MPGCARPGRLAVAPFGGGAASQRGYYMVASTPGRRNPDAADFGQWLRAEAARSLAEDQG